MGRCLQGTPEVPDDLHDCDIRDRNLFEKGVISEIVRRLILFSVFRHFNETQVQARVRWEIF